VSIDVPARGGTFTEGILGTPRFVNPVLAITSADRDMNQLIYAGIAQLGEDGTIVPDIAESITVSDDGFVYNIVLRGDVFFHDGTRLTANDVAFTIERIQDPLSASPLRASWDGVVVEVLNDHELNFVLQEPYAPFMENLTVGILPAHIWKEASYEEFPFSQYNSEPIGSGPYKIKNISRDTSGIPDSYVLTPHTEYHNDVAKINTLVLNFYANEEKRIEAFNEGVIDAVSGISPNVLDDTTALHNIVKIPLPRTFAVFFNQNKSDILRDASVRRALNAAIDRNDLIANVLDGYGRPLHSPIPEGFGATTSQKEGVEEPAIDRARAILRNGGWQPNEETGIWEKETDDVVEQLTISLSTANTPIFEQTALYLKEQWETLGVVVQIKQFEQSDLTQTVIRPRDYEALLFGTALGRALDFYSFWHSSQRNDPGLNIALYANIAGDAALSTARTSLNIEERNEAIQEFTKEVLSDVPAIFLFSPEFVYILPQGVTTPAFTGLGEPHERFTHIENWYMDTDFIWTFLQR